MLSSQVAKNNNDQEMTPEEHKDESDVNELLG